MQSSVTLPPPQQQPLTFYVAHPFTHVMWLFPSNQSAVLKHNTVNFGMLYSGGYAAPHASRSMTINFYNNTKHENQTTQWLPLPNVSICIKRNTIRSYFSGAWGQLFNLFMISLKNQLLLEINSILETQVWDILAIPLFFPSKQCVRNKTWHAVLLQGKN